MIYTIRFTALSSNDLSGIFEYIAIDLGDEGAAKKLFQKIMKSIDLLSIAPLMHKLYDVYPWNKRNMHIYSVNDYSILYIVNIEKKEVIIARIVYSKMDLDEQLKRISGLE